MICLEYYKFKEKYKGADFNVIGKVFDVSVLSGEEQKEAALKLNAEIGIEKIREYASASKEFRDEIFIPMRNEVNKLLEYEQQLEQNLGDRDLNQYLFSSYTKYNNEILTYLENINSVILAQFQQFLKEKISICERRFQLYCEIDDAVDNLTPGRYR